MSTGESPGGSSDRGVGIGLALTAALHVLVYGLAVFGVAAFEQELALFILISLVVIGLTQLFYMGPAILIAFATGRRSLGKGLIIGAAITAGLNSACWGLVTASNVFMF